MNISQNLPSRWSSSACLGILSSDNVIVAAATFMACIFPNTISASCLGAVLLLRAKKTWRKEELLGSLKIIIPVIFILTFVFNITVADPAQAALFDRLRTFAGTAFPNSVPLVDLIFNVITFLLLAYFAVSIVLIIKGIIDGQPIASLIQTPITIVLVVVITEILIPFLV